MAIAQSGHSFHGHPMVTSWPPCQGLALHWTAQERRCLCLSSPGRESRVCRCHLGNRRPMHGLCPETVTPADQAQHRRGGLQSQSEAEGAVWFLMRLETQATRGSEVSWLCISLQTLTVVPRAGVLVKPPGYLLTLGCPMYSPRWNRLPWTVGHAGRVRAWRRPGRG